MSLGKSINIPKINGDGEEKLQIVKLLVSDLKYEGSLGYFLLKNSI